jgi:hypothetical protein
VTYLLDLVHFKGIEKGVKEIICMVERKSSVRLSLSEKPGECWMGMWKMIWGEFWERRGGIMAD